MSAGNVPSAPATAQPQSAPAVSSSSGAPSQVASASGPSAAAAVGSAAPSPAQYAPIIEAPDRSAEDLALDAGRHPAELLTFAGIVRDMKVAELGAGGGYTAELLARVVGPGGEVYGQNSRFMLERFAEGPWSARLKKPVMAKVVRVDREFDEPLPPEVNDLDAVLLVLFYHDTVWMKTNRQGMNRAIFNALKPGGVFVVVDHSARPGRGVEDAKSLHRIEEAVVLREVQAAGFRLQMTGDFLRNPEDSRDWNASPSSAGERRGTSDRFALRFVKPQ
jgi:predicted methyltransferase